MPNGNVVNTQPIRSHTMRQNAAAEASGVAGRCKGERQQKLQHLAERPTRSRRGARKTEMHHACRASVGSASGKRRDSAKTNGVRTPYDSQSKPRTEQLAHRQRGLAVEARADGAADVASTAGAIQAVETRIHGRSDGRAHAPRYRGRGRRNRDRSRRAALRRAACRIAARRWRLSGCAGDDDPRRRHDIVRHVVTIASDRSTSRAAS